MDKFYTQENCDRCNKRLTSRTMSMFNEDCICMDCKAKEREHKNYKKAQDAEINEVRSGNLNFKGIGYKK